MTPDGAFETCRARFRRLQLGLLGAWVPVFAYGLGLYNRPQVEFDVPVDGVLAVASTMLPALVCLLAWWRSPGRRWDLALVAVGTLAFAVGDVQYMLMAGGVLADKFPSWGDLGYLTFYPAVLMALVVHARRELRGASGEALLDAALGSFAAATLLALVLDPVVRSATGGPVAVTVAVAYPVFDVLLVMVLVGTVALLGRRAGHTWWLLVTGLAVLSVSDVVYAEQILHDSYVVGAGLDDSWALGLAFMATWAVATGQAAGREERAGVSPPGRPAITSAAVLVALAVLACSFVTPLPGSAVALALATLAGGFVRTQLAMRALRRMTELRIEARTDDLTGLPNRRAFYDIVTSQLAAGTGPAALLLLDLDRFKEVNDSLGHHAGDDLLLLLGQRLRQTLPAEHVLARLGGDEFAVLLSGTDGPAAAHVAACLRSALTDPFDLQGIVVQCAVSIGIAVHPEHGGELSVLLRRADIAMYRAKTTRTGQQVYEGTVDDAGEQRLRLVEELRTALDEHQFVLHYQPKVDLTTHRVVGVEALVRWDHPHRGLLYPDVFLGVVEDAGLMRAVTREVLTSAVQQVATWRAAGTPLSVAVNLSASSFIDTGLPDQVRRLLAAHHVPTSLLQLEITEDFLMTDRERAREILIELRELGVQIAVDDFGTGYSSLAYLRELPIDELKLDRSFVSPMADDERAASLVASTIALAHSLGLRLVAEGVENFATYTELAHQGCDLAQGYYLSRPLPAAELDHWLATSRGRVLRPAL